jgi:hypothetical protein
VAGRSDRGGWIGVPVSRTISEREAEWSDPELRLGHASLERLFCVVGLAWLCGAFPPPSPKNCTFALAACLAPGWHHNGNDKSKQWVREGVLTVHQRRHRHLSSFLVQCGILNPWSPETL